MGHSVFRSFITRVLQSRFTATMDQQAFCLPYFQVRELVQAAWHGEYPNRSSQIDSAADASRVIRTRILKRQRSHSLLLDVLVIALLPWTSYHAAALILIAHLLPPCRLYPAPPLYRLVVSSVNMWLLASATRGAHGPWSSLLAQPGFMHEPRHCAAGVEGAWNFGEVQ